jgi:hypothetical protein
MVERGCQQSHVHKVLKVSAHRILRQIGAEISNSNASRPDEKRVLYQVVYLLVRLSLADTL